jgi:hypothetical protein
MGVHAPLAAACSRASASRCARCAREIAPGRAHGLKSPFERAALIAFDLVNAPLTAWFNVRGDRVVVIARKRG